MKNRYYDREVRESLEIDMAVDRCGQDHKVENRDNGNFHYIQIWRHFVLSDGSALCFHQFENRSNQCG